MTLTDADTPKTAQAAPSTGTRGRLRGLVHRMWNRLDEPIGVGSKSAKGRAIPGTLIIAAGALIVGAIMSAISYHEGWMLLYGDAQAHLVIARRVIDSQNTGFQQLGTVWLPVPHILLLPFVSNFWLWQTGLAGAFLGTSCLAVSAAALWRITMRVGFNRTARLVTVTVFIFNPAMLYLSTTALTEPVLLASILCALAGLSGWITASPSISPGELAVFAGIPSAAAVLTRYEGWAFVAVASAFVIVASWRRWRSKSYTLTLVLSYVAAPAVAVIWWLSYNFVRFGDPLDFARGQYSAAAQNQAYNELGMLTSKANLGISVQTYNWTVSNAIGIPMLIIALLGVIVLIWERNTSTTGMLLWIPAFVYPFEILSLYLGQTIIQNDVSLPPGHVFNVRYGVPTLIMVALLAGVVVNFCFQRRRIIGRSMTALILAIIVGFGAWAFADYSYRIAVIREVWWVTSTHLDSDAAVGWLAEHYEGGYILIDDNQYHVLKLGVPLDHLFARFNGESFEDALKEPWNAVDYVVADSANPYDQVGLGLAENENFADRFYPVFTSGTVTVWQNSKRLEAQP